MDRDDAEANVDAASRSTMRFVPVKSVEQQDIRRCIASVPSCCATVPR
jgi:transposase